MNSQDCYTLVSETLKDRWNEFPPIENVKNFEVGIHLFTKVIVQVIEKSSSSNELLSIADKVNNFIKKHSDTFWRVCETNFPFSKVDSIECEASLKIHLLYPCKPFIIRFMLLNNSTWMTEEELDACFNETFKHLTIEEIKEACWDLWLSYRRGDNSKAGYYLLWFINQSIESRFQIPDKENFDDQTVKKVLSSIFNNGAENIKFSTRFFEILFFIPTRLDVPFYQNLFDAEDQAQSIDFTVNQLQEIDEDTWHEKRNGIKAFNFTRRLKFNGMTKAFVYNNLIIGVYENKNLYDKVLSHLIGYDINTEKTIWGLPLNSLKNKSKNYNLNLVDDSITLQFEKDDKIFFIRPDIGEVISTLTTPHVHMKNSDALHIIPNSLFCYQMVNLKNQRTLIGGKIVDSKWISLFEVKTPPGLFIPLSTHVGFHDYFIGSHGNFEKTLTIFGPSGVGVTIKNCLSVVKITSGNKLYLIEKNLNKQNTCLLTVRSMTDDENVVSEVEKCILINIKEASLVKLCDNGEWILFNDYSSVRSLIFVNIDTEEVVYSPHTIGFSETIINIASGEIWSWDPKSKEIWKTSSKESTLMGSLQSNGVTTSLLHVDENDYLYYADSKL